MDEAVPTSVASRPHDHARKDVAWLRWLSRSAGVGLISGAAILPGVLAVLMTFFYLGDWPTENPFDQVFYAVIVGAGVWIVLSLVFLHGMADVRNGDSAAYDELVMRWTTLQARVDALGAERPAGGESETAQTHAGKGKRPARETRETALIEAGKLLAHVWKALEGDQSGSALRWAAASGYTSLWRELHRAEEALLAAELKESLYAEAVDDEARLMKTKVDEQEKLLGELQRMLGDPKLRVAEEALLASKLKESLHAEAVDDEGRLVKTRVDEQEKLLAELQRMLGDPKQRRTPADIAEVLDAPEGRALMRKIRFALNSYRDDLFQRFVRIRNGMFATLVYVGLVFDGLLALAMVVAPREREDAIAVALAYFLVGALVGLFAELYGASKGQRGAVHDYGLALVRLLTIPVLSGIAAVLGVIFTRIGSSPSGAVTLDQIFSLRDYPLGIVVAAIFGLTPGLLLERLRTQTNEYKEELTKSSAGAPGTGTTAGS